MKHSFALAAVIALAFSVTSYAQRDPRDPGIYAIVDENSLPLSYDNSSFYTRMGEYEIAKVRYKGEIKSSVVASDTFILVIDPELSWFFPSEPFVKDLTPEDMMVIPLYVNLEKKCREYKYNMTFCGHKVFGIVLDGGLNFDWEQISDNSFKIKIHGLVGGEYGIAFNLNSTPGHEYSYQHGVFGFSVPEGYSEDRLTEDAPSDSTVMEASLKIWTDDPQL